MFADMRNKISFKQRSSTQNLYGEETTWNIIDTVWASVEPLLGREFFSAETVTSNVQIKFRCRWFSGIDQEHRIVYDGKEYEILSAVNVKSLNREWLFYAKRVED